MEVSGKAGPRLDEDLKRPTRGGEDTKHPESALEDEPRPLPNALSAGDDPWLSGETASALTSWAGSALTGLGTVRASHRAQRQNALRMLLGMSPDHQVS